MKYAIFMSILFSLLLGCNSPSQNDINSLKEQIKAKQNELQQLYQRTVKERIAYLQPINFIEKTVLANHRTSYIDTVSWKQKSAKKYTITMEMSSTYNVSAHFMIALYDEDGLILGTRTITPHFYSAKIGKKVVTKEFDIDLKKPCIPKYFYLFDPEN
jgi:hypothetical protein